MEQLIEQALQGDGQAFREIYQFNCCPGLYVHHSHIADDVSEVLLKFLRSSVSGICGLSRYVVRRFALTACKDYNFGSDVRQLALLESRDLHRLLLYTGVAYCNPKIKQIVDRNQLDILKEALGDQLYQFAIKRAPFYFHARPELNCFQGRNESLLQDIINTGCGCLSVCFAGERPEIWQRVKLKLSAGLTFNFKEELAEDVQSTAMAFVMSVLRREITKEG